MQSFIVRLQSSISQSFRCQKAANSLDIDVEKKSIHELKVAADIKSPYQIGLILGASGSGKTTLARQIFGKDFEKPLLDPSKPVIDQFPPVWTYEQCAEALAGMGLTSVPCWIRPAYTLSNGQRARAEAALQMARMPAAEAPGEPGAPIVIDEWTSVVDRTVAKVMSHCIQKWARRTGRRVILLSCHYDVLEWLNPDWVIDCNTQSYADRRAMVGAFERTDRLRFEIRECDRNTWPNFSRYHYLSDRLPGGKIYCYGLYQGQNQIGFQCYAAYIIGNQTTFFFNRTVVHPDYAGLGLGIRLITETAKDMVRKGFKVRGKFSSVPVFRSMQKNPLWRCTEIKRDIKSLSVGRSQGRGRADSMRSKTTTYHFEFIWREKKEESPSVGQGA
jgi:ABC-type dipeptide/oligopeptide/nickel transport system ATPase subunit/predicted GNAT family acetyltransferase